MYLSEFRFNWQQFMAAAIGIGLGYSLGHYTLSLFGPPMIEEFGWSRSQFALVGSLPFMTVFLVPVAGRLTDRFGPRISAMIGFTALPLGFLGFALMSGDIVEFFAIYVAQSILGIFTTSLVFCRVIVERFDRARGIALSMVMTAPPLAGAIAAPTLGSLIDAEGWRAGYFALAAITAVAGLVTVTMMGRTGKAAKDAEPVDRTLSLGELRDLLRNPVLILIVLGMFLVNIPQVIAASQLKLVLMDSDIASSTATWMLSLYAIGVIAGRFASGFALDRVEAHIVALAALGLPAIGYLVFAAEFDALVVICIAVSLIGLAQGAESDIGAYLVSRRFDLKHFSLLLSFLTTMILAGAAAGSAMLSLILSVTDSYRPFMYISAGATLLGALLFVLTGHWRARGPTQEASSTAAKPLPEELI